MKAGRELDALIAEKVMGTPKYWSVWFACSHYGNFNGLDQAQVYAEKIQGDFKAHVLPYSDEPNYSTSIEAAWEVVERLIALHFHEVQVRHWVDPFDAVMPQGWMCQCEGDNLAIAERATTAPLAICLAALKAVDK